LALFKNHPIEKNNLLTSGTGVIVVLAMVSAVAFLTGGRGRLFTIEIVLPKGGGMISKFNAVHLYKWE